MEMVEQHKQNLKKFIISEFVIFLSQIAVFFMVAVFSSNFLNSEEKLVAFVSQKINNGSLSQFGLTLLAILVVIGLFAALERIIDNKHVDFYVNEILCEMPKTIYVFGSSITGAMLAVSFFIHLHPIKNSSSSGFALLSLVFAFIAFVYGCSLSYAFKRKTHILAKIPKPI